MPSATRLSFRRLLFAALGIALIINCSGGGKDAPTAPTAPVAPVVVGSVTVGGTPAEGALLVGGSVTLTATAVSTTGSTVSGRTTTWSSSDPSVATVAAGAVVGVASGPVTISASVDGVVGRTTLSVRVPISTPPAGASTPTVAAVLSGAVTLTIPPTAVPTGTALSVAPAALPSDNRVVPATTYVFGPDGTTFSSPLTLALRYDKAAVATADQSTLWLASVDASGVATPIAGSAVDLTTGVVSAPVSHFSSYTIIKPAAPASITVASGDAQSATVGTAPSTAISVRVLDASSRPVPGAAVRFAVASGNGTLSGTATATTNYLGVATVPGTWVLGTSPGAQTLSASLTGGSVSAATITANATPGAAVRLVINGTSSQVAGSTEAITITAKDGIGNTATSYTGVKSLMFSGAGPSPGGQNPTANGTTFGLPTNVTFTSGVATLPLVLTKAGVSAIGATDGTIGTSTSDQLSVIVNVGAMARLELNRLFNAAGVPAGGGAFAQQPIVNSVDAMGNRISVAGGVVVTMSASPQTTLLGTATVPWNNNTGSAAFSDVGISWPSNRSVTLTFSAPGLAPASQTISLATGFVDVVSGDLHSCGLTSAGAAYCWGDNSHGQLGDGTTTTSATPVAVQGGLTFASLVAGGSASCGVTSAGGWYCWGNNSGGRLGDGSTTDRSMPVAIQGGQNFTSVSLGFTHSCGVTPTGSALCWGLNSQGQLGDGSTTNRTLPVAVQGGLAFATITAGEGFSCGLTRTGAAYCWGTNGDGALGLGAVQRTYTPLAVDHVAGGLAPAFISLASGHSHTCGLTSTGAAWCWGNNQYLQTGSDIVGIGNGLTRIQGSPFTALAVGGYHNCGRTTEGAWKCWGFNQVGQLGDGTGGKNADRSVPVPLQGGTSLTKLALGAYHTCGLDASGMMFCWGQIDQGQLGDGETISPALRTGRYLPLAVLRPNP